jgi:hypothetical protein
VRVWDLGTGQLVHSLTGHQDRVDAVGVGSRHGRVRRSVSRCGLFPPPARLLRNAAR